jgi:hypothetical protein
VRGRVNRTDSELATWQLLETGMMTIQILLPKLINQ